MTDILFRFDVLKTEVKCQHILPTRDLDQCTCTLLGRIAALGRCGLLLQTE